MASLHQQKFSINQIRLIAEKSDHFVREYCQVYDVYSKQDNQRLNTLLQPEPADPVSNKNPVFRKAEEVKIMSKPLTKEQIQLKKARRIKDKNLRQILLYPFLNHYGYDKGEITAKANINDMLDLIEEYFLVSTVKNNLPHIHYGELVWMAVPVNEYPQKEKVNCSYKDETRRAVFYYR